ncbi:TIGR02270 family protein [Stieleria mannarensis]|uniref:TIGR02270 family protein n=1 Tax=Stieleria mannarensis TaxID=2755585 RepID=UPI0016030383|nr:TIGR02270 family protein [Rhodopirellula sp. JC639]
MNFILDQHAAGASASWLRRDAAVGEPHYSLRELAELDGQLESHLEGLRLAGASGWDLAVEELKWQEPGELFVVAALAIESGEAEKHHVAFQSVGGSAELRRALISALAWASWERCMPLADQFLQCDDRFWRYVGVAAYDLHRVDPGDRLADWLCDDDETVVARAARCVGTLGRLDCLDGLNDLVEHENDVVRFHAAWALALRRRNQAAIDVLSEITMSQTDLADRAGRLLTSVLSIDQASRLINQLAQGSEVQVRLATILSGHLGIVDGVPWLIEMMKIPDHARVAGEAFSRITGLRLDQRPLEGESPAGFIAGPDDDPNNDDVELDADENLPWPCPETIAAWWQTHHDRFAAGVRYLLGWEVSNPDWLRKILVLGRQRERATAAIELAINDSRCPLMEVRGRGPRQITTLGCGRLPTEEYRCNRLESGPASSR